MGKEKTYTLTLSGQELHDLIEAALVCECQAAQIINGLKRKGLDMDAQKLVTQNARREPGGQPGMEEGVGRMRTNLAERLGYEPPEIPEGESLEERRERIRAIYQWRKAMRRLARLGCIWLSGVGFALCIIAGCAHATEIAAVLGGVSLTTFLTGIWL